MATYVLVHGGFHGAWCWKKVTPLLQSAGHKVYTPTLTGLGERAHLLTPDVGVDTHIQDVVELLKKEDLRQVILLGHSYGGMVITGVADRMPDRVAHLVYLDTFVPQNGEAMADIVPLVINRLRREARTHGDGWRVDPLQQLPFGAQGIYGITEESDLSWVLSMETPQSLKTFEQPLSLRNPGIVRTMPRTHIYCTGGGFFFSLIRRILMRCTLPSTEPGWRFRQLPTGHDCMITMPRELADLLLEIADTSEPT